VSSLAPDRQPSAVTKPAIAPDVHHPFDVHLNLLAQVAFDRSLLIDDSSDAIYFFLGQLSHLPIGIDSGNR
jgi:hypothetical protein